MNPTPAQHPGVFEFDHNVSRDLPILAEEDISDFTAVLRGLARGTYPRQDAVPNALNAYNLTQTDQRKAWAYFHEITDVQAADARPQHEPEISLDDDVIADLNTPWQGMRPDDPQLAGDKASYRFLCFIHRHRIKTRYSGQKAVYTISIWDRELEWLSWHDMYPHGRSTRQRDVDHFWRVVDAPDCAFLQPRDVFMKERVRWRMTYHACEKAEAALRDSIAPRYTLWAVMAIGLHHMNNGSTDRHINLVPDEFEVFAGSEDVFLPTMFVRLLWLCMRSPRQGEEQDWDGRTDAYDGNDELKKFVDQFRIVDRLAGMKADVRRVVKALIQEGSLDWLKGVTWFFPTLRILPK
ncbi:hypothetical protein F4782DRAFT_525121 [Xylaria castorea]|nr:hypothetical protein F4782DRAFT_525121 [Xylaria castorea]